MKVVCPQCERLSDLERFRFEGGVLTVTCTKCGAESTAQSPMDSAATGSPLASSPSGVHGVPAKALVSSPEASNVVSLKTAATGAIERAAEAARTDPFEVPAGRCPKCLASRVERAPSCAQCGLVYAKLDARSLEPPTWLADAWKALLASWGDEVQHDKLRKRAVQADALAHVGRLYRLRLVSVPDDPYAIKGRDDVLRLAAAPVLTRLPEGEGPAAPSSMKIIGTALLVSVALGMVMVFLRALLARSGP